MAINALKEVGHAAWKWAKGTNFSNSMKHLYQATTATKSSLLRNRISASGMRSLPKRLKTPIGSKLAVSGGGRPENIAKMRSALASELRSGNKIKMSSGAAEKLTTSAKELRGKAGDMAKQYFWPSAYNPAWEGSGLLRNVNISQDKVGMARLRRTGSAALAAWSGVNIIRSGDNIGPF